MHSIGAPRPRLARPPYFRGPQAVAEAAAGTCIEEVFLRSIGSSDWEAERAEQIVEPVLATPCRNCCMDPLHWGSGTLPTAESRSSQSGRRSR